MTYSALEVSRYIIKYSDEKLFRISNLKLQKLMYFVQSHFLVRKKEICFYEDIEAWDFGPVVPEVYREYRQFGSGNIPAIYTSYKEDAIEKSDKILIEEVVETFSNFTATELVDLTHSQDPWKNSYERGMNRKILIRELEEYFS